MGKLRISKETLSSLIAIKEQHGIYIEGNIVKLICTDNLLDNELEYLKEAKVKYKESRNKTYKNQKEILRANEDLSRNKKLLDEAVKKAQQLREEAVKAKQEADLAKEKALEDLDTLQKKKQTEMMGTVINFCVILISAITVLIGILYSVAMFTKDQQNMSTMANMVSTIYVSALSSAFSIIGTILGVKHFTSNSQSGSGGNSFPNGQGFDNDVEKYG